MTATAFEIYQAQADVLVPVVRALEQELGTERARRLVRDALGDHFRRFGEAAFNGTGAAHGEHFGHRIAALMDMFSAGDALDYEVDEVTEDAMKFRVTRCRYAEMYKKLGAPELGFMFVCYQDYPFNDGMGEGAVLERPQTIMEGASHCEFNWYVSADKAAAEATRRAEVAKAQAKRIEPRPDRTRDE